MLLYESLYEMKQIKVRPRKWIIGIKGHSDAHPTDLIMSNKTHHIVSSKTFLFI